MIRKANDESSIVQNGSCQNRNIVNMRILAITKALKTEYKDKNIQEK